MVGWTDFAAASAADDISQLAKHPKLVGLRPMIQDIADDDWVLRADLAPAFKAMIKADLTFDALILPRHLSQLRQLMARHPDLRTVIDHAAKPDIAGGHFDNWANDIAVIAKETRAFCKLSGLLSEASKDWTITDLAPYVAHLFEHFGPERLVWGSDWPVLTIAADYGKWLEIAQSLIPNKAARSSIFGSNAIDLYRLPNWPPIPLRRSSQEIVNTDTYQGPLEFKLSYITKLSKATAKDYVFVHCPFVP